VTTASVCVGSHLQAKALVADLLKDFIRDERETGYMSAFADSVNSPACGVSKPWKTRRKSACYVAVVAPLPLRRRGALSLFYWTRHSSATRSPT
jgi:hypothetical protein